MSANYRKDRILVKASELRPGDVDRLNKALEDAGLGRPLRQPETGAPAAGPSGLTKLAVAGADPMAIRDAARAHARQNGEELPALIPPYEYDAGTVENGARPTALFTAAGIKSGHGTVAWLPAPAYELPAPPPWQPHRPPVIALLDSGVQPHDWLPKGGKPTFTADAQTYGWKAATVRDPAPPPGQHLPYYGSHFGHATFIAGLIRLAAPGARMLSLRVMNNAGKVDETDVANALAWLAGKGKAKPKIDVDIVLMCFGRPADHGDPDLDNLRTPIKALSDGKVQIVASAGNDGSEHPVYPAAFAAEPGLSVVSVGALTFASPAERAPFSNFGPWVREWQRGMNIVSCMPLTTKDIGKKRVAAQASAGAPDVSATGNGFAWWSGTSFAAAIHAGHLASQIRPGAAPRKRTAGP
jgi:hypothetical protein